eukprot:5082849-Amphidinium_carterae.1
MDRTVSSFTFAPEARSPRANCGMVAKAAVVSCESCCTFLHRGVHFPPCCLHRMPQQQDVKGRMYGTFVT